MSARQAMRERGRTHRAYCLAGAALAKEWARGGRSCPALRHQAERYRQQYEMWGDWRLRAMMGAASNYLNQLSGTGAAAPTPTPTTTKEDRS